MFNIKQYIAIATIATIGLSACDAPVDNSQIQIDSVSDSGNQMQEYKIGVILSLTGDAGAFGVETQRVLDYEIEKINQQYKDKNVQFKLIYEDGQCDGARAVDALNKLTDFDNVDFILGGLCSSESLGIAPLLESKNVVALSGWSSNPELEGASENFFSLSYSDNGVAFGISDYMSNFETAALISEQNDYNAAIQKIVLEQLKEDGVEIVADEEFPKGSTDLRNIISKVKSQNPDVVLLNPNPGITTESLAKQIKETGDWDTNFVTQYAWNTETVLNETSDYFEGKLVQIDAPNLSSPELKSYMDDIIATKGELTNLGAYYTASSLDALNIMTKLIAENDANVEAVKNALNTQTFSGWITDKIEFNGNTFVQNVGTASYEIVNNEMKLIES
ncbi:ABC transporter substrate-binding protein [Candidatus Peregrinibacteria bacterium]|nr:ABC transporter substrate-binding protein [Candidatus Peregrinibacteria bacterium]